MLTRSTPTASDTLDEIDAWLADRRREREIRIATEALAALLAQRAAQRIARHNR